MALRWRSPAYRKKRDNAEVEAMKKTILCTGSVVSTLLFGKPKKKKKSQTKKRKW